MNLNTVEIGKQKYQNVYVNGFGVATEPGLPALPTTGAMIKIPSGADKPGSVEVRPGVQGDYYAPSG